MSVQITTPNSPKAGPGRPVFPLCLLKDKTLKKEIKKRGIAATRDLDLLEAGTPQIENFNAQTILYHMKSDIMKMGRKCEKNTIPKLLAEIQMIEEELARLKKMPPASGEDRAKEVAALTRQVSDLKIKRMRQLQQNSRARFRKEGSRPTKYWTNLNRERAPREPIPSFEREGRWTPEGEKMYEKDPKRMAELARNHHSTIQRDNTTMRPPEQREADIVEALGSLDAKVTEEQTQELVAQVSYDECELALRFSKNGTAPGLDGIQYEVWKTLHERYIEDSRFEERAAFDVMRVLQAAFNDIQTHGVCEATKFSDGWMSPIYKEKGERTKVVNYRPITLLNTDYKLLTKVLTIQLASVAPDIIHPSQAGFVPGRKLRNHTQLAHMIMHWAEANEVNGAIVALDQEKAYDKVAHDYLWRVLECFGIPAEYIAVVQALYAKAETSVMVNGVLSSPYRVYRGVRQGDPLSCLLFDLAIEPLSAMIRKSDLRGYDVPEKLETLKATLFANDTTVYLAEDNDFETLQRILDTWCSAAKVCFNISKTEIIPIGTKAY